MEAPFGNHSPLYMRETEYHYTSHYGNSGNETDQMSESTIRKSTDELKTELKMASSLKRFLQHNEEALHVPSFSAIVENLLEQKGLTKAALAKRAGMSEVYLYQLFSGRRKASRTRMICLCIGLGSSLDETQQILRQSGVSELYPRRKQDAIIMYGILHHMNLFEINDLLFEEKETMLV